MRKAPGWARCVTVGAVLASGYWLTSCGHANDADQADPTYTDATSKDATYTDEVAAAKTICPIMWTWVKDIGAIFNAASTGVADLGDPTSRRDRWLEAFIEMDARNVALEAAVAPYRTDPTLDVLVSQIERDLLLTADELDDIRTLINDTPEIDEGRHQNRTSQLLLRVEKVIDLPKPELAPLDTSGTLIAAFQTVPSCQHSMKDVDNGSTQDNG